MNELLFLAHRIPYPPNKGDKLRSFNLLKQLGRYYRVHVGAFIDDEDDWRHVDAVKALAGGDTFFAQLTPWRAKLRSLPALLGESPLCLPYYRDASLQRWVDRILSNRSVRQVVIFSGAMAQYVAAPVYRGLRRIVDFVDVDSDKWNQYAMSRSWPMNWVYRREARTLLKYERNVATSMDAGIFVSASEAALFKQLAPEAADCVWDIHNGVDTVYFDPAQDYPVPYSRSEKPIVFTGAMDYWANVDAVTWFAQDILPKVRQREAAARFYIVGARPGGAVQQLAQLPGVKVTGAVKDIRPYLAHALPAVAPMRIARGVQNKVLEAMAMARPVVATPQALDGIVCEIGKEVVMAQDADAFADKVCEILANGSNALGEAARLRVMNDYSWEKNMDRFRELLEIPSVRNIRDPNKSQVNMTAASAGGE